MNSPTNIFNRTPVPEGAAPSIHPAWRDAPIPLRATEKSIKMPWITAMSLNPFIRKSALPPRSRQPLMLAAALLLLLALASPRSDAQQTNSTPADKPAIKAATNAPAAVAPAPSTPATNALAGITSATNPSPAGFKPAPTSATNLESSVRQMTPSRTPGTPGTPTNRSAAAPPTNTNLLYEAFKSVAERNIFNQSRYPRRTRGGDSQPPPVIRLRTEAFGLVGVMTSDKGTLAFFDGTSSQYRKAVKVGDSIGTYKLTGVTPNEVKLDAGKQPVGLKIGQQLRREGEGEWKISDGASGFTADSGSTTNDAPADGSTPSTSSAPAASGGAISETLRRLMEKREKETQ